MENKTYSGIGSRSTPDDVLEQMRDIATLCHMWGYRLNSGGADGADTTFETALDAIAENCNIFLPWPKFNGHLSKFTRPKPEAYKIAATIHPAWNYLNEKVKPLIARNIHQVLGWSLQDPVEFVACWTADGIETKDRYSVRSGGTGVAIALANSLDIPVFNLCNEGRFVEWAEFMEKKR